jgi:hypothetical protein
MMNGGEKSDSATVAIRTNADGIRRGKPANKAGEPVAEPVEPRAGTKGNAEQGGTLRTPGRAGASHALDRVRQAAKERKKERFTALLHHITVDMLKEAFFDLRKKASAGIDGLTWETYETDFGHRLEDLHSRFTGEHIGRCRAGGSISPSRMDGSGRWRSPRWRTRSSNGRQRWC